MDLFTMLPDRAAELSEVALRMHAWGEPARSALLGIIVSHPGGKLLCEVLLQHINWSDDYGLRSVKVIAGCLKLPFGTDLLYTTDAKVLVEILLRELPIHARDAEVFPHY